MKTKWFQLHLIGLSFDTLSAYMCLIFSQHKGNIWNNVPLFRAATAGLGKYRMDGYGWIEVYRVNCQYSKFSFTVDENSNLFCVVLPHE